MIEFACSCDMKKHRAPLEGYEISSGAIKKIPQILKDYLRSNVKNIYGDSRFPAISVCGKSGTSQVGGGQTSNALFAGFAKDERYPLAFVCVVENGGYGATTCIPILSNILWECMAVMDAE